MSAVSPVYSPVERTGITILSSPPYEFEDASAHSKDGSSTQSDEGNGTETLDLLQSPASVEAEAASGKKLINATELETLRIEYLVPEEIEMRVPMEGESPEHPPSGYFTLYEHFLKDSYLWFPIPSILIDFVQTYNLCLAQLTPNAIRAMLGILVRCLESGIDPSVSLYRSLLRVSPGTNSEFFCVAAKSKGRGLIIDLPNKVKEWWKRFFFVRQDQNSLGDHHLTYSSVWNPLAALRRHIDSEEFTSNFSELSRHGCSWGESFSLARVVLARSTSPALLHNLQVLTPASFDQELAFNVEAKSLELNKEIDTRLAAKGLKRSVVLGQAASSTLRQSTVLGKRPAGKTAESAKAKRKKKRNSPLPSNAHLEQENEALRKELNEEKKKSRRLERELGRLRHIDSDQAGELDVGTSSAQDTELVSLEKLHSLEDLIERQLERALSRFTNLMGDPLKALINLREINENIALVEDLKSGKVKDLGVELSKLHDERKGVQDAQTHFFSEANKICSLLSSERE